ncbi:MAG: TRAP transporter substrate-binding protein [Candidatus Methylomirabilales bacterium]
MRTRAAVLSLMAVVLALAVPLPGAPALAQQRVVKVGLTAAEGTPEVVAAREFAKILEKKSNGVMRADVLAGGLAGGERDIVEGQQLGSIHFSVVSGIIQNFDPAMMILEYEFLFKSEDHVRKVFAGPVGQKINQRLANKAKLQWLSVFMRTPRLLTTRRPVNKLEDLKGMKIRVPEMPARLALWKALGAAPTPLAFPEVFTGLQLGTIDGQENPIGLIYSAKFHEIVKHLALTNHVYGFMLLTVSSDFYKSLSEQQRAWVNASALEAAAFNDKYVKETEADFMQKVTKTMTVSRPDVGPWREATKDVYKQFLNVEGFGDLYQSILDAGKDFK